MHKFILKKFLELPLRLHQYHYHYPVPFDKLCEFIDFAFCQRILYAPFIWVAMFSLVHLYLSLPIFKRYSHSECFILSSQFTKLMQLLKHCHNNQCRSIGSRLLLLVFLVPFLCLFPHLLTSYNYSSQILKLSSYIKMY